MKVLFVVDKIVLKKYQRRMLEKKLTSASRRLVAPLGVGLAHDGLGAEQGALALAGEGAVAAHLVAVAAVGHHVVAQAERRALVGDALGALPGPGQVVLARALARAHQLVALAALEAARRAALVQPVAAHDLAVGGRAQRDAVRHLAEGGLARPEAVVAAEARGRADEGVALVARDLAHRARVVHVAALHHAVGRVLEGPAGDALAHGRRVAPVARRQAAARRDADELEAGVARVTAHRVVAALGGAADRAVLQSGQLGTRDHCAKTEHTFSARVVTCD